MTLPFPLRTSFLRPLIVVVALCGFAGSAWAQAQADSAAKKPVKHWTCYKCGRDISGVVPYGYEGDHPLCQNCCGAERAGKGEAAEECEAKPFSLLTTKRLTGDWGGARTAMEDAGVAFAPLLITNYQQNFRGGANTHNASDITGRFFYNVELDFEKMGLIPGATFFYRALQQWHTGIGGDVGTSSAPYYGSGSPGNFFYGDRYPILTDKWWYRQRLLDDRIEFRLGKLLNVMDLIDKNNVSRNYASRFMNRSLNFNQTIPVAKGIGAYAKFWPTDWFYFLTAAINSDSRNTRCFDYERAFHGNAKYIGHWEFGFTPKLKSDNGDLPGNYRFGFWYNSRVRTKWRNTYGGRLPDNQTGSGDVGWYMNFDQMLYKENPEACDKQGLSAFFRYGYAHGEINRIAHSWNVGALYTGLIPERDNDSLGFAVAQNIQSNQYRRRVDSRADRETVYELFYSIQVTPWFEITPDVQVITNPGGSKDARDAIVGGLRAKITF